MSKPGSQTAATPLNVDTWWTTLRWSVALWLAARVMWIAPPGSARDRWGDANRVWANECLAVWRARYPEGVKNG
jgi:hypothetical protein